MSSAKKCDRCGKFFESRFNVSVELTTYNNAQRNVEFDCGLYPCLDLCPDCIESFKHWWANETVISITKKRGKNNGPDRKTT